MFLFDISFTVEVEISGNKAHLVHAGYTHVDDEFKVKMVNLEEFLALQQPGVIHEEAHTRHTS